MELSDGASDADYNAYNYMVLTAHAKPQAHTKIPSVVHADGTGRLQIVRVDQMVTDLVAKVEGPTTQDALMASLQKAMASCAPGLACCPIACYITRLCVHAASMPSGTTARPSCSG